MSTLFGVPVDAAYHLVFALTSVLTPALGPVAAGAMPVRRRVAALRRKSWRVSFLPQRDPDARGRSRPRAPSAAPAAA